MLCGHDVEGPESGPPASGTRAAPLDCEFAPCKSLAQGDGTHRLPVKAALRKIIGKEAGDTVHVRIDERIG